ncbi:MAG: YkgJ family cysteine cluster protein [Burkholderiales bacterium]
MADGAMTRATPFSYACGRCSRCCRNKGIMLNPYEVLRLARNRGLTTTQFIARHTDRAGTRLAQKPDGSCVFLTAAGCGVHADRPLVCRIYPLARHISPEDAETFTELEPHPQTEGRYGTDGTVGDYLEAQGAEPFMQAADRYLNLFRALADSLSERFERLAEPEREAVERTFVRPADDAGPGQAWLDIDRTVDEYCRERGVAKPEAVSRLMEMHLEAMAAWSSGLNLGEAP